MDWKPLSARYDEESAARYDGLHEGWPDWIRDDVRRMLVVAGERIDQRSVTRLLSLRLRRAFSRGWDSVLSTLYEPETALDVLDGFLFVTTDEPLLHPDFHDLLEETLSIGGSGWTVARTTEGIYCLERRVDATSRAAFDRELQQQGNPSHHLAAAWHACYRRDPDASSAYREAVRAVEAAAKPAIAPTHPRATLGTMIANLRQKPSGWAWALGPINVPLEMMAAMWTSQLDRHGTDDETVPLTVTIEEAEAALHLALVLVHWLRSGSFAPVS